MSVEAALDVGRRVADAVLLEGYVLYPYRASAQKNRVRWQFGVLTPREAASTEPWFSQTECLVEPGARPALDITARFLQVRSRTGALPWDEGVVHEVPVTAPLDRPGPEQRFPFEIEGGEDAEDVDGHRVLRRRWPLSGVITVGVERLEGPYGLLKLRVRVENHTPWKAPGRPEHSDPEPVPRETVIRHALVSTHALLAAHDAVFVSLLDPPEWARPSAESCTNQHTWPVLVGGGNQAMLSSPIILYDHPEIAPESPADLCDATEIDEILTLRTMALTDEEKAEARATDARAAGIIDRVDTMPAEVLERLHGAVRYLRDASATGRTGAPPWWDPGVDRSVSPEHDSVQVPGGRAAKGSKVVLWPGGRGAGRRLTDAQDIFLKGRVATVTAVLFDVDGGSHLAVTFDDDPAADLHEWYGRYLYFTPDEVQLVKGADQLMKGEEP
ncbi:MAG: hypothetical protein ACRDPT_08565 [Streptomycetales bacterium]